METFQLGRVESCMKDVEAVWCHHALLKALEALQVIETLLISLSPFSKAHHIVLSFHTFMN